MSTTTPTNKTLTSKTTTKTTTEATTKTTTATSTTTICHGCQQEFSSRNAIFKHLEETNGACLSPQEYQDFCRFHEASKRRNNKKKNKQYERALILYGYLPEMLLSSSSSDNVNGHHDNNGALSGDATTSTTTIRNGHDAAELLLEIMWQVDNSSTRRQGGQEGDDADEEEKETGFSYQRSYGNSNRQTHIVKQDDGTGAVSEVMATKLLPLIKPIVKKTNDNGNNDQKDDSIIHDDCNTTSATTTPANSNSTSDDGALVAAAVADWVQRVNQAIEERLRPNLSSSNSSSSSSDGKTSRRPLLRVFGRLKLTGQCAKFNAELDVAHRHVEYLLPADFLYNPNASSSTSTALPGSCFGPQSRLDFFQSFATFCDAPRHEPDWEQQQRDGSRFPHPGTRNFMHAVKKIMQRLTTQIVEINVNDATALQEKERHLQKRFHSRGNKTTTTTTTMTDNNSTNGNEEEEEERHHQQDDGEDDKQADVVNNESKKKNEQDDKNDMIEDMNQASSSTTTATALASPNTQQHQHQTRSPRVKDNDDTADSSMTLKQPATKKQRKDERRQKKSKKQAKKRNHDNGGTEDAAAANSGKGKNMLQRKRYHNFTPTVMAHEYLAYRRLDRLYHRATLRFDYQEEQHNHGNGSITTACHLRRPSRDHHGDDDNNQSKDASENAADASCRPFFSTCMTGDLFLQGQVCRVLGLFIALVRGVVDEDFVDCVFDPHYPHLVQTPPLPSIGLYSVDALYMAWEGKAKAIFSPRPSTRYPDGFNHPSILQAVDEWHTTVRECTAQAWLSSSLSNNTQNKNESSIDINDSNDAHRLVAEREWTENVLEPWGVNAREQLQEYRKWKEATTAATLAPKKGPPSQADGNDDVMKMSPSGSEPVLMETSAASIENEPTYAEIAASLVPSLDTVDPAVPEIFQEVLHHLRLANDSGLWPSTTPKRQLVMISSLTEQAATGVGSGVDGQAAAVGIQLPTSLCLAREKAKSNKDSRMSPYVFAQGEGGASGSFSVGVMPEDYAQPKANQLFPELTKAAFKLEGLLCKDREPSSTIAINRNAQFRPHTDSGAGAGQSTSLIVGLGTYAGGELVVEGEKNDIRYQAAEFDGWKQRHWTMPFTGERYSLVWFTPKGCEGLRGIDLYDRQQREEKEPESAKANDQVKLD